MTQNATRPDWRGGVPNRVSLCSEAVSGGHVLRLVVGRLVSAFRRVPVSIENVVGQKLTESLFPFCVRIHCRYRCQFVNRDDAHKSSAGRQPLTVPHVRRVTLGATDLFGKAPVSDHGPQYELTYDPTSKGEPS